MEVLYGFYTGSYLGNSIPEEEFPRLAKRAEEQLTRYQKLYRVRPLVPQGEELAVCGMADALYYFETAQNGGLVVSSAIGSVSSSVQGTQMDLSAKAQARELYRSASLYLDIYRGVGRC